jgi:hypothetical protein
MRRLASMLCAVTAACAAPPPAPVLSAVAPAQVDALSGGDVELRGAHLRPAVTLDFDHPATSTARTDFRAWLERGGESVELADVTWLADGLLSATVPGGLAEGRYDVHLVDPAGREAVLVGGLTAVDCLVTSCPLPDGGAPDASIPSLWTACADFTFRDIDLDGFGEPGSGAFLCGPYRAAVEGDCNDRDSLMSPGAAEVCNGLDDDCDGVVDDGACPGDGGAAWARIASSGPTWQSAWSWTRGGLWVGGGREVRVTADGGGFSRVDDACPDNVAAVWAQPSGRAYVAGGTRVALHELGASGCGDTVTFSEPVVALVGFPRDDGGVHVVGLLQSGGLVSGEGAVAGPELPGNQPAGVRFSDVHGVAPGALYAVGWDRSKAREVMKAFRRGPDGGWEDEHVERLELPRGRLRAVWALDEERAVAVGDDGVVLERTPFGWLRLPDLGSEDIRGVRAFGLGRVYVVGSRGTVRRWDGRRWQQLFDGAAGLRDIAGTAEDDLWAVGAGGTVLHWPEAP